ncbi:hypothetical protein GNI_056150 [Gregarina niphandrodes]|uniref:Uncharacterized protein n=1 Tax=Gregarina niphandrodes TaxID=110365 RepID=A0A023B8R1_GRENI|nr:hypothetical protein GNI_056150 [Gregarina niphandrodes]EZG70292.1 hypothetical protein GNI_056150 [Gregarina niphandrodes]|eukprot:XP_011129954.1 hypothetical protein GNI_056150 [Gregarina niphandrodes]
MLVCPKRSSSTKTALVAALTVFLDGKPALANTAAHGTLCVEVEPLGGKTEENLKVKVAVPCAPFEYDLDKFSFAEHCSSLQIMRGSIPDVKALEFGASILGEAWTQLVTGAGGSIRAADQHERCQQVLQDLGMTLFAQWGNVAQNMAAAAALPLVTCKASGNLPRVSDSWRIVKTDNWRPDGWMDATESSSQSWSESLAQLCSKKTLLKAAVAVAVVMTANAYMTPSAYTTPNSNVAPMAAELDVVAAPSAPTMAPEHTLPYHPIVRSKHCGPHNKQFSKRPYRNVFWTQECEDTMTTIENYLVASGCSMDDPDTCWFVQRLCPRYWAAHGPGSRFASILPNVPDAKFNYAILELDEKEHFIQEAVTALPSSCDTSRSLAWNNRRQ